MFCLNHCIRNQCDTKCNLWVKEKEFMVSHVNYSHFSSGIAQGIFIVMNTHSRIWSQKKCQFNVSFKDIHFPSTLCTRNTKNKMWGRSQYAPTVYEIINYLLTSSVTRHLSLTMALSFNCFLVLLVLCFYFSGSKWKWWPWFLQRVHSLKNTISWSLNVCLKSMTLKNNVLLINYSQMYTKKLQCHFFWT